MNTLSTRQIRSIQKAQEAANKRAAALEEAARKHAFGVTIADAVAEVTSVPITDKDDSSWAGWSVRTVPVTLEDGTEVTVSMTVTHVARTAEKTAEQEAAALAFLATPEGQALIAQQG